MPGVEYREVGAELDGDWIAVEPGECIYQLDTKDLEDLQVKGVGQILESVQAIDGGIKIVTHHRMETVDGWAYSTHMSPIRDPSRITARGPFDTLDGDSFEVRWVPNP